jgi:hypothetical protein
MRRMLTIVTAVTMLVLPTTAAGAKGPTAVRITGLASGTITIDGEPGSGEPNSGGDLARLAEAAGLWANTFEPTRALGDDRPAGTLGPRLRLSWVVPGPTGEDIVVQDVHPWADGGAVTHTPAEQDYVGMTTFGGWYVGGAALHDALVDAGVPAHAPSRGSPLADGAVVVAGLVMFGALGLVVRGRRTRLRRAARLAST